MFQNQYKYLLIIMIAMIFSIQNSYADYCDEIYNGYSCTDTTITDTIVFPEYPNCSIPFNYNKKICTDSSGNEIVFLEITGYQIINSPECNAFYNDNLNPDGTPNWNFMIWVAYHGFETIAYEHFLDSYNSAKQNEKYKYECPNYYNTYSIIRSYCTSMTWRHEVGPYPSDPDIYIVEYHPCTEEICCERTIQMCYNTQTQMVETIHDATVHSSGDCGIPDPPLYPPFDLMSPCIEDCYIPQQ